MKENVESKGDWRAALNDMGTVGFFARLKNAAKERRLERKYRRQRAKRGYTAKDLYDMREWFVKTVGAMLSDISENLVGYPDELSEEEWRATLKKMAHRLKVVDVWDDTAARAELGIDAEDNSPEASQRISTLRDGAKEEFFQLFNKWFYDLGY